MHFIGNFIYDQFYLIKMKSCYRSCLELMKENNCASIAFPLINSEKKGYSNINGAHIGIRTVRRFLEHYGNGIEKVIFCLETVYIYIYYILIYKYYRKKLLIFMNLY